MLWFLCCPSGWFCTEYDENYWDDKDRMMEVARYDLLEKSGEEDGVVESEEMRWLRLA